MASFLAGKKIVRHERLRRRIPTSRTSRICHCHRATLGFRAATPGRSTSSTTSCRRIARCRSCSANFSSACGNAPSSSAAPMARPRPRPCSPGFEHNGLNPVYLSAVLPGNFSQGARFTDSEWIIIEGDEYDTAFFDKRSKSIHYQPGSAPSSITSNLTTPTFLKNLAAVQKAFSHLIRLNPQQRRAAGQWRRCQLNRAAAERGFLLGETLGLGEHNSVKAFNLNLAPTASEFEIPASKFRIDPDGRIQRPQRAGRRGVRETFRALEQADPVRVFRYRSAA